VSRSDVSATTPGDPGTSADTVRLLHRHDLRIRTVAVSFAAAVSSARNDFRASGAERDALIEAWRTWSLDQLQQYGRDLDDLSAARPELTEDVAALRAGLDVATDKVRRA
jgi:hypothetical protein